MPADTSAGDPTPAPSSRPLAVTSQPSMRVSPVSLISLAGFAALVVIVALPVLPAYPGASGVAGIASAMIWVSACIIPGCLGGVALSLWSARVRALTQRFAFMRIGRLATAILLPPALVLLVYGLLLRHSPSLWNPPLVAVLCGPLAAGALLALIAYVAGQLSGKEITDYLNA